MKPHFKRRGFTLPEILTVSAILLVLVGILVVPLGRAINAPRAAAILQRSHAYAAFIRDALNSPTFRGQIPVTRSGNGGVIPTAGQLSAASTTIQESGVSFDLVMVAERMIERFEEFKYGAPGRPEIGVRWDTSSRAFVASPDLAATVSAIPSTVTWQRIESRLSNPALSPELAQGANFQAAPGLNLPSQAVVVYWRFPGAPQSFAEELAKVANKPEHRPASGAPALVGPVAYATPVDGITDVYLYICHQ